MEPSKKRGRPRTCEEEKKDVVLHIEHRAFFRLPEVLVQYPVGKSTWWAGVKSGKYPAPVKLSTRTTAWRREDIERLFQEIAAKKDA